MTQLYTKNFPAYLIRSKINIIFVCTFLFLSCSVNIEGPDTIFVDARIYTVADQKALAEAVAVKDGRITAVGTRKDVLSEKGASTQIIDLDGMTMVPGFIDSHAHFMGLGYAKLNLDLSGTKSYEELVDLVRQRVAELTPGTWVLGRGWHQDKWDSLSPPVVSGFPTHTLLSAVSPDNPVFLRHASGHAALANARAMEMAGISRESDFHEGGEIIKDEKGEPTGIFNEVAMSLIGRVVPKNDAASDQQAFEEAVNECLSNGVTSFHDAGVHQETIDLYKKNLEEGKLKVRMYAMLSGSDSLLLVNYFKRGPEIGLGNDFLTIRSIKLYSDGALGSRGAWLLQPYEDMPGECGHSTTPIENIFSISEQAAKNGFQVCTHAIGDRGNREVLDQYQRVFELQQQPSASYRYRVEHAQHLHPDDIPRFGELGVLPAMQAIHMSSDRPWAIDRLGQKRIVEGAYVWQKLLQTGAIVINGTDAPVEPIDPLACFYASVSRRTLAGPPPGGYEADQKMTREQALRSYTLDAAYGAFEEDIKGSIEVGKYADFTVLDKDIMEVEEDEILNTKVAMTIINGKILYSIK